MHEKFLNVFGGVKADEKVRAAFKDAYVEKLTISKSTKILHAVVSSESLIPNRYKALMEKAVFDMVNAANEVKIDVKYNVEDKNPRAVFDFIWEDAAKELSKESPVCGCIFEDCEIKQENNKIIIMTGHNAAFYLYKKGADKYIEQRIKDEFVVDVSIAFKNKKATEEEIEKYDEAHNTYEKQLIDSIITEKAAVETAKETAKAGEAQANIEKGIILGKDDIKGEIVKIKDTKTEGEKVIIEGEIFNLEEREIKGDKYIVSFDIIDGSDSTTVKFFTDKKPYECDGGIKSALKGAYVRVKGEVQFDKYAKELIIMSRNIAKAERPPIRMDTSNEKRVELHLHTNMSTMDAVTSVKDYIKRAAKWGHKAIAVTDHGVVQAFPDAMDAAAANDIKVIYGVEAYLIDDLGEVVINGKGQDFDDEYVVFDIETTGLNKEKCKIIEIGAVKIKNRKIIDRYSTFIDPGEKLTQEITELTNITDKMLTGQRKIDVVLPEFLEFVGDAVLVAHNASFDTGFIRIKADELGITGVHNTILDTLELSRTLLKDLKKHKLDIVAKRLGVSLEGHHRTVNDAEATAEIFLKLVEMLEENDVHNIDDINIYSSRTVNYNKLKSYHTIILVKNLKGLRNLYELISMSNLEYFHKQPRIPKSKLIQYREGLIVGSACEAGELYRALLDMKPKEYIENLVNFYDYLEIQPLGNNMFMIDSDKVPVVNSVEDIKNFNRKIVSLGEEYNKPVVATCDCHFLEPEDAVFRKILMYAKGFEDAERQPPLYFRTTEEMLREFYYLGEEKAKEIVITNTNLIADMIEQIKPVPDGTFPPKIEGAEEQIQQIAMDKAHSIYGDPLPKIVEERLDKELKSIIKNGFSVMYIIAQKLVWKSNEDGYLVGSRGSVGSSFVANMTGITEVNSLPPHYVCPNCKYSDFESEEVQKVFMQGGSGVDMPDKVCPKCGTMLKKDGHDIPFETFLGFDGDKEPDIDLNFSGEYQQQAHAYTEVLFGKGHVFKAGTIGTLADKTAYGYVKRYVDDHNLTLHNAEMNRLVRGCTGVKRTTGQHPGGLMIVPKDKDIYEFCPIQHPADDVNSTIITTHFDYHSISGRILKLDLLGHDDPTFIRMLYDITGVNPQDVPLDDKETMSLFRSPEALGVTAEQINCPTGTLGVPEFGTKFVRKMLIDTKPETFSDLLRISGLSHGTNVWIGNAQELIENGTITLKETIATRDSIMSYLITKGLENKKAFKIMEKVRKGKGLADEDIEYMKEHDVPQWYIDSCQKIKYMFPKAHAAAYVMMAYRIAYFKINYPEAYYATYFTVRAAEDFDYSCMCKGKEVAKAALREIEQKGNDATAKDQNKATVLESVIEFYERGFNFLPIDLYKSDAKKFKVTEDGLLIPPFNSLQGLGVTAAQSIVDGRDSGGEFKTIEEFKSRTSAGASIIDMLKENGVLKGIPESDQISLFDF
ncbi:MAG: PolC-type DNA polymerase III [Clostridiales bacterium]|nr:PolC-type DNA polymerase III [Clostridiales bacterium]